MLEILRDALALKNPENIITHDKLRLAIEVYSTSFFEISVNAKFIALVTVLEILKEEHQVSELECETIDEVVGQIGIKRKKLKKENPDSDYYLLDNLMGNIGHLKTASKGKSIQMLIAELFDPNVDTHKPYLQKIKQIYRLRGDLLHDGIADKEKIRDAVEFLNNLIPELLLKIFFRITN